MTIDINIYVCYYEIKEKERMVYMKPAGFILKIDQLGRIVIPKPIRTQYDLNLGDSIEVFNEKEGILMKKYHMSCSLCANDEKLIKFKDTIICEDCLNELKKL